MLDFENYLPPHITRAALSEWIRNHRILVVVVTISMVCYPFYFVINELADSSRAHDLTLLIDRIIPFSPEWEYIYFLIFHLGFLPVIVIRDDQIIWQTGKAYGFALFVAYAIFLVFPTEITRPHFQIASFVQWGARLNYFIDAPHNCFPSIHLTLAFLSSFIIRKVSKIYGNIAIVLAVLIGYSTLAVKQHFFIDVIAGIALGFISYKLFVRNIIIQRSEETGDNQKLLHHPMFFVLYSFMFAIIIASLYTAYRYGWQPWS